MLVVKMCDILPKGKTMRQIFYMLQSTQPPTLSPEKEIQHSRRSFDPPLEKNFHIYVPIVTVIVSSF